MNEIRYWKEGKDGDSSRGIERMRKIARTTLKKTRKRWSSKQIKSRRKQKYGREMTKWCWVQRT